MVAEEGYVDFRGYRTWYRVVGDRAAGTVPLLALHGGPKPRPELEAMAQGKAPDVYRAMQGPNEWTTTGALKGWDTRARLHEIDVPTLVVRGRYDMCTEPIAR